MIVRIVQMQFQEERVAEFLELFENTKSKIRNFPGVLHLDLLQETNDPSRICTYSHWEKEEDLEVYRNSKLFEVTWAKTKQMFAAKPKAWSSRRLEHLPG